MSAVARAPALLALFGRFLEHEVLGSEVGGWIGTGLLLLGSLLRRASGHASALRGARCPPAARRRLAVDARGRLLDVEVADQVLELFVRDLLARLLAHEHAPASRAPLLAFGLHVHGLTRRRGRVRGHVADFARDACAA